MLVIQSICDTLVEASNEKERDVLELEWYEANKRILRKRSRLGRELQLRFLKEAPALQHGDLLYEDDLCYLTVEIRACDTLLLRPASNAELALACYEIGNRHLPLYHEDECLLMPYDAPVFRMLQKAGFAPERAHRRLTNPLRSSVAAHPHDGSLLSRILEWTQNETHD